MNQLTFRIIETKMESPHLVKLCTKAVANLESRIMKENLDSEQLAVVSKDLFYFKSLLSFFKESELYVTVCFEDYDRICRAAFPPSYLLPTQ